MVACSAENNCPTVGPELERRGRDMFWIRIDRFEEKIGGDDSRVDVRHVPMMCQHCNDAPCEIVCPVYATYHNPEGLNAQVYNRCVGTRYCSNNCPYKVRRFNFLLYQDWNTPALKLQRNPDVSVRSRGVMEKCTYCVQRIRRGEIDARIEERALGRGEIQSACQQACPTGAIVFGSITDRGSEVALRRENDRAYEVLHELGTDPRTRYLAKIDNPNPAWPGPSPRAKREAT